MRIRPDFIRSEMPREKGFSFIELVVVIAMLSIITAVLAYSVLRYRERTYDTVAFSDYRNVKTALFAAGPDPDETTLFLAFDVEGPAVLPGNNAAALSEGVQLDYLIRWTLPGAGIDLAMLQLGHEQGSLRYRFWEINGVRSEQRIAVD